jgi:hypothetical protein
MSDHLQTPTGATAWELPATALADVAASESIRQTVRWVIAAGGTLASIVVAGVQLSQLAQVSDTRISLLAGGLATMAILCAGTIILSAARVLVSDRPTIHSLAMKEAQNGFGEVPERHSDPIVKSIIERRLDILGGMERITDVYQEYLRYSRLFERVIQGDTVEIGTRGFDIQRPSDLQDAKALQVIAEWRRERLESFAEHLTLRSRFHQMMVTLGLSGIVFAFCATGFVFLIGRASPDPSISSPVRVSVYVPNAGAAKTAGLAPGCAGDTILGVAVGGTYSHPRVATENALNCPPAVIATSRGLVIRPIIPEKT